MAIEFLDPTHERDTAEFVAAERLDTIAGTTIAIVSNGKKGTKPFFDAFAAELTDRYGAAEIVRLTKSNYSEPAASELFDDAAKWNALVAGVGD
ncbi:MAG TPA: hypothetical protein QF901_02805 [Gammaproteobacteria bacterium]|jgi:hypothetical protein|nr:hypothetical protein [Gammaproteobacteria bacterium]